MNWPDTKPIISYTHSMRSRYSETDRMGYVYYARYLEYFEVARTEMIRSLDFSYRDLEESGIMLPVIDVHMSYHAPVHYDELMFIKVFCYEQPAVKLNTYYKVITDKSSKPHVTGSVTLCFMNADSRKPCRAPDQFLKSLQPQLN